MPKIGSGPKSSDDATYAESRRAFDAVLDGDVSDTTLGGYWLANRWKTNTPEELAGFLDAARERTHVAEPEASPVDCGANYDGKTETALLGVAAGIVAAETGTPVVVHSADHVPTGEGTAYKHVLDELGVATDLAPEESAAMVDETGFGFYYQPRFAPDIDALLPRRRELGVRSFVNTIETVLNPADARVHVGSFYHLAFAKRVIDTLDESTVGVERVVMFQGLEGYDDVRPGYTKVADWDEEGGLNDYEIETAEYGMDFDREDLGVGDITADSARITREALAGERDGTFADAVALNAALRIYAHDDAPSVDAALADARDTLSSGDAYDRLEAVRGFEP